MVDYFYHNCYEAMVSSIIEKLGGDSDCVWFDLSVFFGKNTEKEYYEIFTNYEDYNKYLALAGVNLSSYYVESAIQVLKKVDGVLGKKKYVGVMLDSYWLDYSLSYQRDHSIHWIEIVSKEGTKYHILDNFFRFEGEIDEGDLKDAIQSLRDYQLVDKLRLDIFNRANSAKYLDNKTLLKIAKDNFYSMQCEIYNDYINQFYIGNYGIKAFMELGSYLKKIMDVPEKQKDDNYYCQLDLLFSGLKNIANTRYKYGILMKKHNYDNVYELCMDLYQQWRAISNFILKESASISDKDIIKKVNNRLDLIIKLEKQLALYNYSLENSKE